MKQQIILRYEKRLSAHQTHFLASHFYFLPRYNYRDVDEHNPAGWFFPGWKVPFVVTGKSKKLRCNKIPTHYAVLSGNASEDIALARRGGQCSLVGRCSHVGRDVRELTLFRQHKLRSCRECRYLTFPNCGLHLIIHRYSCLLTIVSSIWRFFYVEATIASAWTRYLFTFGVVELRKEGLLSLIFCAALDGWVVLLLFKFK